MCNTGALPGAPAAPSTAYEALDMVLAGLGWLANTDVTAMPAAVRAECLRRLEQARSVETAAHAAVLSAFDLDCGFTADGQCTSRTWLRWL